VEAAAVTPDDNKEEAQGDEEAPRWHHGPALRVRRPFREAPTPEGGTRARRGADEETRTTATGRSTRVHAAL